MVTLGPLFKVGTHNHAQENHLFYPTSASYTFPGTTLYETSLILQHTSIKSKLLVNYLNATFSSKQNANML